MCLFSVFSQFTLWILKKNLYKASVLTADKRSLRLGVSGKLRVPECQHSDAKSSITFCH